MRVSDNTNRAAVGESIRKSRGRMEELQTKNASQKKIISAADDPAAHTKIMDIRTQATVNTQFESNAQIAKTKLVMTDNALSEMYDVFVRAKEIAINQASDASANDDSRLGVAQEVSALYKQLVSLANRRNGQTYLFSGFKTLTEPYTVDGEYRGDRGYMPVEIQKDVYINSNITGPEVFEFKKSNIKTDPVEGSNGRVLAGAKGDGTNQEIDPTINAFRELDALRIGLLTNDTQTIRSTLDGIDQIITNTTTLRTKISSRVSGIDAALGQTSKIDQANSELLTQLEDADYAELWSDLAREETILRSSMQAAQKLIQPTLLDFLK